LSRTDRRRIGRMHRNRLGLVAVFRKQSKHWVGQSMPSAGRPRRWGWKVLEAPGVEPFFRTKDQTIGQADTRASFSVGTAVSSSGRIRTYDPPEAD
jgi:hypothetical protein